MAILRWFCLIVWLIIPLNIVGQVSPTNHSISQINASGEGTLGYVIPQSNIVRTKDNYYLLSGVYGTEISIAFAYKVYGQNNTDLTDQYYIARESDITLTPSIANRDQKIGSSDVTYNSANITWTTSIKDSCFLTMHLNAHEFNVLHKPLFNRNIDETTYSIRLTVTLTNKTTQDQIITNIIHIGLTAYVSIWLLVILGIIIGAIILAALFSKWYNRKKLKRLKIK